MILFLNFLELAKPKFCHLSILATKSKYKLHKVSGIFDIRVNLKLSGSTNFYFCEKKLLK